MSCIVCSVIPIDGNWIVESGTVRQGPYMSNGMALRVAATEALALHKLGQRSRISVQNSAGEISAEYCLCAILKRRGHRLPQLAASFISSQVRDVCFWHLTDKPVLPVLVRFRTRADNGRV